MLPLTPPRFEFIHFKGKEDLPHLAIVFALISAVILGVYLSSQPQIFRKQAAEKSVSLSLIPNELSIEAGKTYDVQIQIDSLDDSVSAAEVHLRYDPSRVSIEDVSQGTYLPVVLNMDNKHDGNVALVLAANLNNVKKGSGIIASLKIKALTSQESIISFTDQSKIAVLGKDLNALQSTTPLNLHPVTGSTTSNPASKLASPSPEAGQYLNNPNENQVVFPNPSSTVEEFKDSLNPKPTQAPLRLKPELSIGFIKQLGQDAVNGVLGFVNNLNSSLEQKASSIVKN